MSHFEKLSGALVLKTEVYSLPRDQLYMEFPSSLSFPV